MYDCIHVRNCMCTCASIFIPGHDMHAPSLKKATICIDSINGITCTSTYASICPRLSTSASLRRAEMRGHRWKFSICGRARQEADSTFCERSYAHCSMYRYVHLRMYDCIHVHICTHRCASIFSSLAMHAPGLQEAPYVYLQTHGCMIA